MTDKAILFLLSMALSMGALAAAVWLASAGQLDGVDGLFLFCVCLVVALAFGLYVRFLIRQALKSADDERKRPQVEAAKKTPGPARDPAAGSKTAADQARDP